MGSDTEGVVGKIRDKAEGALAELRKSEAPGDADPDVEYEPTPNQHVMHDGMVVLNESQTGNSSDGGRESGGGQESGGRESGGQETRIHTAPPEGAGRTDATGGAGA